MENPLEKLNSVAFFDLFNFDSQFQNRKVLFIIGALVLIFVFNILFVRAPSDFPLGTIINIKDGSSLRSVSKEFKDQNIIKSRAVFETFVILFGGEKVVSGDYYLDSKISVIGISRRVSSGDRRLAPVKVTIPEGFNNKEIAEIFSIRLPKFNTINFMKQTEFLEGYLFPDTYFFLTTDDENQVISAMNKNFDTRILALQDEISKSGKSEHQIITMASIIEEEAKGDRDREYISGILWKRISIGMTLQVDADPTTYKERGLPKAPITNPGLKSIEAAIYPKASKYLYYLHDKNGLIHYAANYQEHLLNIKKYLK